MIKGINGSHCHDILTTKILNLCKPFRQTLESNCYQNDIRSKLTISKSDAVIYN